MYQAKLSKYPFWLLNFQRSCAFLHTKEVLPKPQPGTGSHSRSLIYVRRRWEEEPDRTVGWGELSSFHLCLSLQPWEPNSLPLPQDVILPKTQRMTLWEGQGPRNGAMVVSGPLGLTHRSKVIRPEKWSKRNSSNKFKILLSAHLALNFQAHLCTETH